jgi:phosphoglucosamine mutase
LSGFENFDPTFGTDGVRARALSELTPEFALRIGRSLARVLPERRMVIAHDPRVSGPIIEAALCAGLAAEGVNVELLGMLPTPAVAAISASESIPGIVVTASHNTFTDNGVKVFAAGGRKLSDEVQSAIEQELDSLRRRPAGLVVETVGEITRRLDPAEHYVDNLVDLFGEGTLTGMRIAIDTANGAMSMVAPAVLHRLGADVVVLNDAPTGLNINDGCGATAPQSLCEFVAEAHDGLWVDIAFAFDGDGDRVIAVDENGKVVDGDRLIALSALERLGSGTLIGGTVVVTVMTNLGFHRAMHTAGIDVVTTSVGDRSVLHEMESSGYVIGGEQSGHIIHRDLATTGDGLLAAIVLARMVRRERAASGRLFSDIAAAVMTNVPQILRAVPVLTKPADVEGDLAEILATARARLADRGRVLVRMSGTEPVVRVMVEADDADVAEVTAQELVSAVISRWGDREPAA